MSDRKTKIFYSWQATIEPAAANRTLIGDAIELALERLAVSDASIDPSPDRDTAGVSGSPDIASTIFRKIDEAAVFVADLSIVTGDAPRPAPNPNVLIEWGYAMRALGPGRVISVANVHFGAVEVLPFDVRARRVVKYESAPADTERAPARKQLAVDLAKAIRACLDEPEAKASSAIVVTVKEMVNAMDPKESVAFVEVQNRGDLPFFISSIGFERQPNQASLWTERDASGKANVGTKLEPGDAYKWLMPIYILLDAEQDGPFQSVAVYDRVGGIHRTAPGELRAVLDEAKKQLQR